MRADSLAPYESALLDQTPLGLHTAGGEIIPLDVTRWLAPPDDVDRAVIERCAGPTLDVGCGPGRFVAALAERGVPALGFISYQRQSRWASWMSSLSRSRYSR